MDNETQVKPNAGLYVILIIILGCVLRLIGLGSSSLTMNEAENALAALRLFSGENHGQLLYTLPTALLFKMFGDSDFTARLVPALSGILLVLLPILYAGQSKRKKMLLLSLAFAVDPVFLFWSKRADAVIPSAAMLAAAVFFQAKRKPGAVIACMLIALCGGERCLPGLIILLLCGSVYHLCRNTDLRRILPIPSGRREIITASVVFLLFVTAFTAFPGGFGSFCTGIVDSLKPAPAWAYPGGAAIVVSVLVYGLIPFLLFIRYCLKTRNALLLSVFIAGAILLILWQGVLALPWINCCLWFGCVSSQTDLAESAKGKKGFAYWLTAGLTTGAYCFFYFRLVDLFNQKNGAEPFQISWNGTNQVLPITRTGGSVILTAASLLIIGLIVKILLGFLDSQTVRSGIITGCMIVCGWWMITNIWNASGFDRIGDHPAAPHPENSKNLLNGNYTGLTDSPLLELIEETVQKHGDRFAGDFGLNFITDDSILDWQLRNMDGIRKTGNPQTDVSNADMILSGTDISFGAAGFVGTLIRYESRMQWEKNSFQNWGKWLLFGDGRCFTEKQLTLWVKGNMVYSAEE